MTLTLILGGALWFALAASLVWGRGLDERLSRIRSWIFMAIGPAIAILMVQGALSEGAMVANAPDTDGRPAGRTRLALQEVAIERSDDTRGLAIGGQPSEDDIVIAGLPAGAVIVRDEGGAIRVMLGTRADDQKRVELFAGDRRVTPGEPIDMAGPVAITVAAMSTKDPIPTTIAKLPDRRTRLTISRTRQEWRVLFAAPELKIASGGNIQPASADLENQPREGENVVAFKTLGGTFAPLLEQVELVLPQAAGLRTYVSGARPGFQDNQRIVIDGAGLEIVLRIDPLNLTSGLRGYAGRVVLIVVLASLALTWRARLRSPLAATLLGTAEVLLALRVLIALEGGMVEETWRSRAALGDALVALPLGLLALSAAIGPLRRLPVQGLAFGGMAGCIIALVAAIDHAVPRTTGPLVFAMAALTVLAAAFGAALPWILGGGAAAAFARAAAQLKLRPPAAAGRLAGSAEWLRKDWVRAVSLSYALGLGVAAARGLLMTLEIKERVRADEGSAGALSIVFVPLTLLAITPLLKQLSRSDSGEALLGTGIGFAFFLPLFVLAPNVLVGDNGLAMVLVISLALTAAAGRLVQEPGIGWRGWLGVAAIGFAFAYGLSGWLEGNAGWWFVPLLLLVAAAALFAWRRALAVASALPWMAPAAAVIALVLLTSVPQLRPGMSERPQDPDAMLVKRTPELRLMAALAPERFGYQLASEAADLRETIHHLTYYVADPYGRRMLNLPLPPAGVKKQQFSDYVVAIHVISPFGRLAAAGLLLILAALATLAFARVAERRGVAWLGILAVMSFVGTAAYITLANALLAPFTGRNFYLLAAQSTSDLVEGMLLLVLAAIALTRMDGETKS